MPFRIRNQGQITSELRLSIIFDRFLLCFLPNRGISSASCTAHLLPRPGTAEYPVNEKKYKPQIPFIKNTVHRDALMSVLDTTCDASSSIEIFKWGSLKETFHLSDDYVKMIVRLGLAGNLEEIEGFVHNILKSSCSQKVEIISAAIHFLCENYKVSESLKIFEIMSSMKYMPSVFTCNVLLSTIMHKRRDLHTFLYVYKEMVKGGILPDVETLNYLIEILLEVNWIDSALDQFHKMNEKGRTPNCRTYEVLITGLCAKDQIGESRRILEKMFELDYIPSCDFFNKIILVFCDVNVDEGLELFRKMRNFNHFPDLSVCGKLIECLCENLRLDDAVKLHFLMLEMGVSPTDNMLVDILNGYIKLGEIKEAMLFLEKNCIFQTSPYNAMLQAYCRLYIFSEANKLLMKMNETGICDKHSWNIFIRGLCENGNSIKAFEVLAKMIVSSFEPDETTYSSVIIGFCKMSKPKASFDLFQHISGRGWVLDQTSYSVFIDNLCQLKKSEEAMKVFYYMSSKDCNLPAHSFNILLGEIGASGQINEAIRLRSSAFYNDVNSYLIIIDCLFKLNKGKHGLIMLSQMIIEGITLDEKTYRILINGFCSKERLNDAILLFNHMVHNGHMPDLETLGTLLSCADNHSQIYRLVQTLHIIASELGSLNSSSYSIIINALLKEGHKLEASKFLDLMLEKGYIPDSVTHGFFIRNADSNNRPKNYKKESPEDLTILDNVGNILADALDI